MDRNHFRVLFNEHKGRRSLKWDHYLSIYERHLSHYKGRDVHIVEIGVYEGGSLQLWKNYFGPECHVFGVDINPFCKTLEEPQIEIIIGDQSSRVFLRQLKEMIPRIDILIDDGGHRSEQQIATFEELITHLQTPGIYICEDTHSSYMNEYGGGVTKRDTFINYVGKFPDALNSWHSGKTDFLSLLFKKEVGSVHFYDSVVVVEKERRDKPFQVEAGTADPEFKTYPGEPSLWIRVKIFLKRLVSLLLNRNEKSE